MIISEYFNSLHTLITEKSSKSLYAFVNHIKQYFVHLSLQIWCIILIFNLLSKLDHDIRFEYKKLLKYTTDYKSSCGKSQGYIYAVKCFAIIYWMFIYSHILIIWIN